MWGYASGRVRALEINHVNPSELQCHGYVKSPESAL